MQKKPLQAPTGQTIHSSFGALGSITEVMGGYNPQKVLLVTGKSSFDMCGAADTLLPQLASYEVTRFSDFAVNPKMEDAVKGAELARDMNPDLILAVGGGSVLDIAKLIKALLATKGEPAAIMTGKTPVLDPDVPLVAVPTTAGSGSESTHFAVVYIGTDKYSLADPCLLPDAVVLDGALIRSGSAYQKTCNGLDALAQAIESSWACGASEASFATALTAVSQASTCLGRAVDGTASEAELQAMLEAANLAGQGINHSKTTAPHAWSYGITSHYGLPHGHAVWMTLPMIFEQHATATPDTVNHPAGPDGLTAIMEKLMQALGIPSPDQAAATLNAFLADLGVETDLAAIGADTVEKRQFLSQQVNIERLSNNPVTLGQAQIDRVFHL